MFKKVLLGFAVVLAGFLGYVALQSPDYRITREITIGASADKVFPYLNSSKLMQEWGPWTDLDPKAKMTFSGPDSGVGAKTNWDEGEQLGTGSATITESVNNERVQTKIEYTKPFQMVQLSEYRIKPTAGGSVVEWSVTGQNTFPGRIMCAFMNMDKKVGGMFEKGLAKLKSKVEGAK